MLWCVWQFFYGARDCHADRYATCVPQSERKTLLGEQQRRALRGRHCCRFHLISLQPLHQRRGIQNGVCYLWRPRYFDSGLFFVD